MIYTGISSLLLEVHNNISGIDLEVSRSTVVMVVQTRLLRMLLRMLSLFLLAPYLLHPIQAEIKLSSSEKSKMVAMTMTATVTVTVTNWWSKTHV